MTVHSYEGRECVVLLTQVYIREVGCPSASHFTIQLLSVSLDLEGDYRCFGASDTGASEVSDDIFETEIIPLVILGMFCFFFYETEPCKEEGSHLDVALNCTPNSFVLLQLC